MSSESPKTALLDQPEVGSYFVATYPPFSVWTAEAVERDAKPALAAAHDPTVPLGLYLHIPFCRKRCHFCYFRVYTDKNAQEVGRYLDVLAQRMGAVRRASRRLPARPLNFVYFGGGTPSFLSTQQLQGLVKRLTAVTPWNRCRGDHVRVRAGHADRAQAEGDPEDGRHAPEPRRRELRRSRSSSSNGRAHRSPEIEPAYRFARGLDFPQINIDLIAGMLGETDENWQRCVEKTVALEPDSVTIYQMELPYNTTITKDLLKGTGQFDRAGGRLGRPSGAGSQEAFEALERAGYHVGSAYTAVKDPVADHVRLSRSPLAGGRHGRPRRRVVRPRQRRARAEPDTWETYSEAIDARRAAARPRLSSDARRAAAPRAGAAAEARARLRPAYFADKYGVDILEQFAAQFESLRPKGYLAQARRRGASRCRATACCASTSLLPRFFLPQHTGIRYT